MADEQKPSTPATSAPVQKTEVQQVELKDTISLQTDDNTEVDFGIVAKVSIEMVGDDGNTATQTYFLGYRDVDEKNAEMVVVESDGGLVEDESTHDAITSLFANELHRTEEPVQPETPTHK